MTLHHVLDAIERFLTDEQSTIDGMLLFAEMNLGEKPLTTALAACGELDASWQRAQAAEVLLDTLEGIVQTVSDGYAKDWEPETHAHFKNLTHQATDAIDALLLER